MAVASLMGPAAGPAEAALGAGREDMVPHLKEMMEEMGHQVSRDMAVGAVAQANQVHQHWGIMAVMVETEY